MLHLQLFIRPAAQKIYSTEKRRNNWPYELKGYIPQITKMYCCRGKSEAFPPKMAKTKTISPIGICAMENKEREDSNVQAYGGGCDIFP